MKTKKATKSSSKNRVAQLKTYAKKKLAVQKRIKVGVTMAYRGRNAKLQKAGRVKVVGHEKAQGGIIVQVGEKKYHISPFALLAVKVAAKAKVARGKAKVAKTPERLAVAS